MPKENSHTDQTKNKKYAFVQREGDDFSCVKLLEGKYKGIIYKYGKVKPIEKDGTATLQFEFDILENNGLPRDVFDKEFFTYIGDILVEIIDEQNNREDNSIASNLERGLL